MSFLSQPLGNALFRESLAAQSLVRTRTVENTIDEVVDPRHDAWGEALEVLREAVSIAAFGLAGGLSDAAVAWLAFMVQRFDIRATIVGNETSGYWIEFDADDALLFDGDDSAVLRRTPASLARSRSASESSRRRRESC